MIAGYNTTCAIEDPDENQIIIGKTATDERGVGRVGGTNNALTFFVYTYTIGPVAYPLTDSNGVAIIDDLVSADFALLVYVDSLADQGYIHQV